MTPKEKSIIIWEMLRDNPGMTKDEAWDILGIKDHDKPGYNCHACIVAWDRMPEPKSKHIMCRYCPVTGWPDEDGNPNSFATCTGGGARLDDDEEGTEISAYDRWEWEAGGADDDYYDEDLQQLRDCAGYIVEAMKENWKE